MMRKSWGGLLASVGVLVLSILGASFLQSTPAAAFGESFRWIGNNAVEMSGGNFNNMLVDGPNQDRPLRFTGSPSAGLAPDGLIIYQASRPLTINTEARTCRMHLELAFQTTEVDGTYWILPANATLRDAGRYTAADEEAGHESCIAWATGSGPSSGSRAAARAMNAFWNEDCYNTDPGWGENEYSSCSAAFDRSDAFPGKTVGLTNPSAVYPELASECTSADDAAGYNECVASMLQRQADGDGIETGDDADPEEAAEGEEEPVCVGGALGWILCPLSEIATEGMAQLADIVQAMMHVQPLNIAEPREEPTYIIWNTMRNIANVLFIIFFLIIIGSYLTSVGISNYGIKRTLPRLIIAAILVNLSYFLCAILIDIFNIIGASIEGLFQIGVNAALEEQSTIRSSGFQFAVVIGGVVTIIAGIIATMGPSVLLLLIAPLMGALFSILTLAMILLARQFIITLLVIFSPIVMVMWLLPGTEQYFKKGFNMFFSLLFSYPVVMAVIQASSLIVAILFANGVAPGVPFGGPNEAGTAIAVLLVQILVVVIVITVLRSSVRIFNQLGLTGGGIFSKISGGIGGWARERRGNSRWALRRKELSDYRATRARGRYDARRARATEDGPGFSKSYRLFGRQRSIGMGAAHEAQQRARWQNQSQERKRAELESVAKRLQDPNELGYRQQYAGTDKEDRMAAALATGVKASKSLSADEMSAHKLVLSEVQGLNLKDLFRDPGSYKDGQYKSDAFLLAGQQLAREKGDSSALDAFMIRASQMKDDNARKDAVLEFEQNHPAYRGINLATADPSLRNKIIKGESLGDLSGPKDTVEQTIKENSELTDATKRVMQSGKLSSSNMTGLDKDQLQRVRRSLKSFDDEATRLQNEAAQIQNEALAAAANNDVPLYDRKLEDYNKKLEEYNKVNSVIETTKQNAERALKSESVNTGAKVETAKQLGFISSNNFDVQSGE